MDDGFLKRLTLKSLLLAIHANRISNSALLYADFTYSDISMLKEEKEKYSNWELKPFNNNKKKNLPSFFLHGFLCLHHMWKLQMFIFYLTRSHHDSAAAGTGQWCQGHS